MRLQKSKKQILDKFSDLELWTLGLGRAPLLNVSCSSPFRNDQTPSGAFYSKGHRIWFYDFSTGENIDALNGYLRLKGDAKDLNFKQKIKKINNIKKKEKTNIELVTGNWTKKRLQYWKDYHIDEDLLRSEVVVCKDATIITGVRETALLTEYHSYAYIFEKTKNLKIYQPFSKSKKFVGNTTSYDVYGMNSIEGYDDVIITSSGKDYLILKSLRDELDLEYDVIAPNGEGYLIPESMRNRIEGTNIILYYDNDAAGIKNTKKHKDVYNASIIANPSDKPKDPSDWAKENKDEFVIFLKESLNI